MNSLNYVRWLHRFAAPVLLFGYVILCVCLGGSGADWFFTHGILQAIGALGLALLSIFWPRETRLGALKVPLLVVFGFVALGALQSIPVPEQIWRDWPGRGLISEGHQSLGLSSVSLPLSLDVEATLHSLGYALPPLFILALSGLVGMERLKKWTPYGLSLLAVLSVALGLAQLATGIDSPLYFFEFTNRGAPVGTFANANHFASFLLMACPFAIQNLNLQLSNWERTDTKIALAMLAISVLSILIVGIMAAGSLAIYMLLGPVIAAAFVLTRRSDRPFRWIHIALVTLFAVGLGALLIADNPVLHGLGAADLSDSDTSRYSIWGAAIDAIKATWPFGTGIGSFESVIPIYEDASSVTSTYVARAHNEYLQIVMEMGLPGVILLTIAAVWLGQRTVSIWRKPIRRERNGTQQAAMLSIIAIAVHSVVDFPARTPALTAVLALCVAIVALSSRQVNRDSPSIDASNPKRVTLQ